MPPIYLPIPSPRMPFTPTGAVTGIRSLPFTSVASAIQSVANFSPEIPFWPQLPRLSEREAAIGQGLGAVAGFITPRSEGYGYQVREGKLDLLLERLHQSNGELTQANAAGFGAFEDALSSGLFKDAVAVKGQIQGPITLSAYLFHRGRPFLSDPALFAAVAFHASQLICWQIDRLKSAHLPVLFFLDEPALCLDAAAGDAMSEDQRLNALGLALEEARIRGAHAGLHCCAARPFSRMYSAGPDILSFEAHEGLDLFFSDSLAIDFVNRGGTVAYGIVPTCGGLNAMDSTSIFVRWLQAASRAGDPQKMARHAMITSTCGLGLLETSAVSESFNVAQSVSKLIRNLAGDPEGTDSDH